MLRFPPNWYVVMEILTTIKVYKLMKHIDAITMLGLNSNYQITPLFDTIKHHSSPVENQNDLGLGHKVFFFVLLLFRHYTELSLDESN